MNYFETDGLVIAFDNICMIKKSTLGVHILRNNGGKVEIPIAFKCDVDKLLASFTAYLRDDEEVVTYAPPLTPKPGTIVFGNTACLACGGDHGSTGLPCPNNMQIYWK